MKNGAPLWGGTLATKGGLVFYGVPEGFLKDSMVYVKGFVRRAGSNSVL